MLKVVRTQGNAALATVHVAELADGARIECVESIQPPVPREKKWVLIVSTLRGCPVDCAMCDAGGTYKGRLSASEILAQIDHLVASRYPAGIADVERLKIQFARMGDPAFNEEVIDVLELLVDRHSVPTVMPCISTIAPQGCERFFQRLLDVKQRCYSGGTFQMQFSLHTTDEQRRRELIPARTWSFARMGAWSREFRGPGDRKVTLNFAPAEGFPLDPEVLLPHFSPESHLVKLTPINPTNSSRRAGLTGLVDPASPAKAQAIADRFEKAGFEVILSIGELEENHIGSNCGMFVG